MNLFLDYGCLVLMDQPRLVQDFSVKFLVKISLRRILFVKTFMLTFTDIWMLTSPCPFLTPTEIMESNINSAVEVETVRNEEGQDVFDRFYVCLDVLRRTWKSTCRPILGVDGCFLRGKTKGQLLVALGRDADNAIYPIAWGVVQVENTDNWLWFVKNIKADLALDDGDGFILISKRQKVSSLSCKFKSL